MTNKRSFFDFLRNSSTVFSTLFSLITFFGIIFYVGINGSRYLSWELISSDNKSSLNIISTEQNNKEFTNPNLDGTFFSYKYGISLKDGENLEGKSCVYVEYVSSSSPFNNTLNNKGETYQLVKGTTLDILMGVSEDNLDVECYAKDGAEKFAKQLDKSVSISFLQCSKLGGGIRGSLICTIYLILLTLLFSLPLGIGGSIYLVLYAKEGKFKAIITNMIDATSGIPSIIFGFVGLIIFVPFVSVFTGINGYSLLAGALTMTLVLLPTIIKTTSEALKEVPSTYMASSLALGASKTQTIFKVILPNALPGILTATLLSIGRIIGESAALIFVMGTSIEDNISIFKGATSLSLHIWSLTKQETPNYQVACSISIIILLVVFLMNVLVKIISYRINKKRGI